VVAAEIVSLDDRYHHLMQKLEDYRKWGVPNIWLAGPGERQFSVYTADGLTHVVAFEPPQFGLRIPAEDLLRGLPV
jgi:Uma2 family endonuclease